MSRDTDPLLMIVYQAEQVEQEAALYYVCVINFYRGNQNKTCQRLANNWFRSFLSLYLCSSFPTETFTLLLKKKKNPSIIFVICYFLPKLGTMIKISLRENV